MPKQAIHVEGLRDLQRELRKIDSDLGKELRKANKEAAEFLADRSRNDARAGTRQQARAARGIRARGTQRDAKLAFGGARDPFTIGAFFGARAYPQFPAWVGNQWDPGDAGGPYILGRTIARSMDDVIDLYGELLDDLTRRAFPEGR